MKKTIFPLSVLFSTLLAAPCKVMAAVPSVEPVAFPITGGQLTPLVLENKLYYLVTSETDGLIFTDENKNTVATLPGHFAQSDIHQTHQGLVVAALDNDTYGIELFRFSLASKQFEPMATIPAEKADLETVCLSSADDVLTITSADALGRMQQHWFNEGRAMLVRTVNVGTGLKSCQINDRSGEVYLADENVGIWQYENNAEADDSRNLLIQPGAEGVAVQDGRMLLVSPDRNAIGIMAGNSVDWLNTAGEHAWETIRFTAYNGDAVVGLYDDESASLFTVRFALSDIARSETLAVSAPDSYLTAFAQTEPVARFGDAADDPAIWYFADKPASSVILGTDKKAGLDLFDLKGNRLQHLPVGRLNNVDVRTAWQTGHQRVDVAAASNRTSRTVDIFTLDRSTRQAALSARLTSELNDLYGLCMYHSKQGELDVLVNDTDGNFERHRLTINNGALSGSIIDRFAIPSQPEGCVADDETGILYYGEEAAAVWLRDLDDISAQARIIAEVGGPIKDDIEGVSLFDVDGERYLIISSQGNHRYGVYSTRDYRLLGTFGIKANLEAGIDGVSETDGIESLSLPLGDTLPDGLLVVQDGHNVLPSQQQNFKLVSGTQLAEFIRQRR